jgi:phosphoribosylformylglycinamidine synthase
MNKDTFYAKIIIESKKEFRSSSRAKLFFISGTDSDETIVTICEKILCDRVTETYSWHWNDDSIGCDVRMLEIMLKPGVTDREADELKIAIHLLNLGDLKVATGMRYYASKCAYADILEEVYNPVIHRMKWGDIKPIFSVPSSESAVLYYDLHGLSDDELTELSKSRKLSLSLKEMLAIKYMLDRPLTDAELETFAQTWSEHCSHPTFRTAIHYGSETVKLLPLIQKTVKNYYGKVKLISVFKDNAGIIEVGGKHISFKVETHNHPSALEPFGGANTGIGGVIRDILGVSAKPIAVTDILCTT